MTGDEDSSKSEGDKQKKSPFAGKPRWLKVKAPTSPGYLEIRKVVKENGLHTVCESAACPNVGLCWHEGAAAFMILGNICTRRCAFCDVQTGRPGPVDDQEPIRLLQAVKTMKLSHVVITSVDRDDLVDGGAAHFVACVQALRGLDPAPTVELLTPDFRDKPGALQQVLSVRPEVFNHNVETVPRLYSSVRPAADYACSLEVLRQGAAVGPGVTAKSGLMLGLGEQLSEVLDVLADLRRVGVSYLTIGQYLRPSLAHHPVKRYWPPEVFAELKKQGLAMGFARVESHPLSRSSFHAEK
ncbi:MAG: lipoyl synthase [Magnetococcales bacterium]|nr:lipoyl synthase [Magnetococcales bacterium]